jgi:hypothetical protein
MTGVGCRSFSPRKTMLVASVGVPKSTCSMGLIVCPLAYSHIHGYQLSPSLLIIIDWKANSQSVPGALTYKCGFSRLDLHFTQCHRQELELIFICLWP